MSLIYNVQVSVVSLVKAETPEEAIDKMRSRLLAAGFEPYYEGDDAFVSEDQAEEAE